MRIAIPLDENKQDVCIVLARAPYFLFREDGKDAIVENPAAQAHEGAGVQVAQFLVDNGVNVLPLQSIPFPIPVIAPASCPTFWQTTAHRSLFPAAWAAVL